MKQFTAIITLIFATYFQSIIAQENQAFIHFSIDACVADSGGSNRDFSEFTSTSTSCSTLSVVGNNLYRTMPEENGHSCTPGIDGSIAMCVGADLACEYPENSEKAIRCDIQVDPDDSGTGQLTGLEFYQKSPVFFSWINGRAGINNTPTKYAVNVLVNGQSVYANTDINATTSWSKAFFDFSNDANFTVSQATVFSFYLTPYCPNPAGGQISVWDIDELKIFGSSTDATSGGTISGGPFTFCVGDGIADNIPANTVSISGNSGANSQWVVTDATGMTILGLPDSPSAVDFDDAGQGTCLLWNLNYSGAISGLEVNGPVSGINGCYSLSNSISVSRIVNGEACQIACNVAGGSITGGPFSFCVGDNVEDRIDSTAISLTNASGANSQWVVTDALGDTILGLPSTPSAVNFDTQGSGSCLIWHLSYDGELGGAVVGGAVSDLTGCLNLSNSIEVTRSQPNGGVLSGGPFTFCVGDSIPDNLAAGAISVANMSGEGSQWIVTDASATTILGLPNSPTDVNFDDAGPGVCLIWHLSFNGELTGAFVNSPVSGLSGCFNLSNSIEINRVQPEGGVISGGPFNFCAGDGIIDTIAAGAVSISNQSGANSQWVVTNADTSLILELPSSPSAVNFDGAGAGTCLLWHLSYDGELLGATVDSVVSGLRGCFSLSNSISIVRDTTGATCEALCNVTGATLSGGPFEFCVGDSVMDTIPANGITVTGNSDTNSQWIVTDDQGIILVSPSTISEVDFEDTSSGVCLIWLLTYQDSITGTEPGLDVGDIQGCGSLSNSITVVRTEDGENCVVACDAVGGTLTGGPFVFCAGDDESDTIDSTEISLNGNLGTNSQWVITDEQGIILGLPAHFSAVEFDTTGNGTCLIWHLSFEDTIVGAEIGLNANNLDGCFNLSNSIAVTRNQPDGGIIRGGPLSFCAGDGIPDIIPGDSIRIVRSVGSSSTWVLTNNLGTVILDFADTLSQINLDGYDAGVYRLWNLSYGEEITGLDRDSLVSGISGCFDLSNNSFRIDLQNPHGGVIAGGPFNFCVGDGSQDTIPANSITLTNDSGSNSQWVITNADTSQIISLPSSPYEVDFDGAGVGTFLIWHLSYDGDLAGAGTNMPVSGLSGCFSLSNSIPVFKETEGAACEDPCTVTASTIAGGPFTFCVGDTIADTIADTLITLTGNTATNSQWVVTNADTSIILGLPDTPSDVDFSDAGAGTCLIWHLSYEDTLIGANVDSLVAGLNGCIAFSNSIAVVREIDGVACGDTTCVMPDGGQITGGPFTFCVGDGLIDTIPTEAVKVAGNTGTNSQWLVTDVTATSILNLPTTPNDVNFDIADADTCLIWHLSYNDTLSGLEINSPIAGLQGCFSLSANSIAVIRNEPDGGIINGGPFTFCVGDAVEDTIATGLVTLTGNSGANSQWVITDDSITTILGLAPTLSDINFNDSSVGTCKIWHLSYDGEIAGAVVGGPFVNLEGCFDLSNDIDVMRVDSGEMCDAGCTADGGMLEGGPFGFCVGDGTADNIPPNAITLSGMSGDSSQWVITDDMGSILNLPSSPQEVNFNTTEAGTCLIWHMSYNGPITGAEVGSPVSGIQGCFNISDSIAVVRNNPVNATLGGGPFTFCVGDGMIDTIPAGAITITDNTGENTQWVVLDELGTTVLGIPDAYENINFDTTSVGTCIIRHISYDGTITGLVVGGPLSDLSGCFSLSNSVSVIRVNSGADCLDDCDAVGGSISGGPFTFCEGDGLADTIAMGTVTLMDNIGAGSSWVVTDTTGMTILRVASNPSSINFEGLGVGTCLLWHLSSEGTITGDTIDGPITGLQGCFNLSDSLRVTRVDSGAVCDAACPTVGGTLTGGPFSFCVDGTRDTIPSDSITVTGNVGSNAVWVVTDITGTTILDVPGSPSMVDFDTLGTGSSLIWLLSFEQNVTGATRGGLVANLNGCFSLSDSIVVTRNEPDGGVLTGDPFTFCSGDGIIDTIPAGAVTLSGNIGTSSQWIITDAGGLNILNILDSPSDENFDIAGPGTCLLYHMSYTGELTGLTIGQSLIDVGGCFDLSNNIEILRIADGDECDNAGANIVINEIFIDSNYVELKNVGNASQDITSYWLCNFPAYDMIGNLTINCGTDLFLEPGETVVVETGINFDIDQGDGEMGLYLINDYTDPNDIIDYVQWGAGGHERAEVAVNAGLWTTGDFVPTPADNMTLNYDGDGNEPSDWSEATATPCDASNFQEIPVDRIYLQVLQNPVMDVLYFNVNMVKDIHEITVDIHDIFGVRVKSKTIAVDYYSNTMKQIDISDLAQGLYFISTQEGYGNIEAKIVIQ